MVESGASSSSFSVHANSGAVRVGATQLHASPATLSVGAAFEFDTSTALPTLRTLGNLHVNGSLHAGGELSADSTNELAQWSLVASDLFSEPVSGWCAPASPNRPPPQLRLTTLLHLTSRSSNLTSTCGGPSRILGGYCRLAGTPVDKTFERLPAHRAVRIMARYYFIDAWEAMVGTMRLDRDVVWTQQHTACPGGACRAVSVCGREDVPDTIGTLIDVTRPHTNPSLMVTFGTHGMHGADPCDVSYGVQAVSVYVK